MPVAELDTLATQAGRWLVHRYTRPGQSLNAMLVAHLPDVLEGLPQPRRMRWGAGEASFLRPVRWLCVRHGKQTIPVQAFGLDAQPETRGHPIHHPQPVPMATPVAYPEALRSAYVLVDPATRRARIVDQVTALAHALDAEPAPPAAALYDELTGLVEWPVALTARFDEDFLELPEPIVVTTLVHHERFIPLRGKDDKLLPDFVAIANLESRDPEQIRHGLARVVRPRLEDARFYYQRDREQTLAAFTGALDALQFAPKLGTMGAKSIRLETLANTIAKHPKWPPTDPQTASRAAALAKCDLATGLVFEFPELQGTVGALYAAETEPEAVAQAIAEQYLPAASDDPLPTSMAGAVLALADRLDTLVGGFAAGLAPSGTRDPYGLRRAAFGILRIVADRAPGLDLAPLLEMAARAYPQELQAVRAIPAVTDFLRERLRSLILDAGSPPDVAQAVLAVAPLTPGEALVRAAALTTFRNGEHAGALAAANKRIANLLRQAEERSEIADPNTGVPDDAGAETALDQALAKTLPKLGQALAKHDFKRALTLLAALRTPVDRFFDEVLVMDPDPELRARRLGLLARLRAVFLRVADIGELQIKADT